MAEATHQDLLREFDSYESWKHCITVSCGIPLTPDYIKKRIAVLKDYENEHTKKFLKTWGEPQLQKVTEWFEQASQELK